MMHISTQQMIDVMADYIETFGEECPWVPMNFDEYWDFKCEIAKRKLHKQIDFNRDVFEVLPYYKEIKLTPENSHIISFLEWQQKMAEQMDKLCGIPKELLGHDSKR